MSVPLPVVTSAVSAALFESGSTNRAYTLSRTGDTRSVGVPWVRSMGRPPPADLRFVSRNIDKYQWSAMEWRIRPAVALFAQFIAGKLAN